MLLFLYIWGSYGVIIPLFYLYIVDKKGVLLMELEQVILLIMEKFKVNQNVAYQLYHEYRKRDKLKELHILLHDLDLDKQQEEIYE